MPSATRACSLNAADLVREAKNAGLIEQRKDGRWHVAGTDDDGNVPTPTREQQIEHEKQADPVSASMRADYDRMESVNVPDLPADAKVTEQTVLRVLGEPYLIAMATDDGIVSENSPAVSKVASAMGVSNEEAFERISAMGACVIIT